MRIFCKRENGKADLNSELTLEIHVQDHANFAINKISFKNQISKKCISFLLCQFPIFLCQKSTAKLVLTVSFI